jgi:uncharacterized protein
MFSINSNDGCKRPRFFWGKAFDNVVFLVYTFVMNDPELPEPIMFEWDSGNKVKSLAKHGVTNQEAEETFFNYKLVAPDQRHSKTESRFGLYGKTDSEKILFIVFTIRGNRVRIISARLADKKERKIYGKTFKKVA